MSDVKHPTTIDPNAIELVERRLAEKVSNRMLGTIKTFVSFAAIFGVSSLAYLLYWVPEKIETHLVETLDHEISRAVREKMESLQEQYIKPVIANTSAAAEEARITSKVTEEITNGLRSRVERSLSVLEEKLVNMELQITATVGKIDNKLLMVHKEVEESSALVLILKSQRESITADMNVLRDNLKELNGAYDTLGVSVNRIDGTLQDQGKYIRQTALPTSITSTTTLAADTASTSQTPVTVFVQYNAESLSQVQEISAAIRGLNYIVPGEEKTIKARNTNQVRYFYAGDRKDAELLAKKLSEATRTIGYANLTIVADDLTKFAGTKPHQGTLEVWVDLPRMRTETVSATLYAGVLGEGSVPGTAKAFGLNGRFKVDFQKGTFGNTNNLGCVLSLTDTQSQDVVGPKEVPINSDISLTKGISTLIQVKVMDARSKSYQKECDIDVTVLGFS